jgi:phage terminase small subunit
LGNEHSENIPMKKLTKKEIAEGIQAMPIERILLGANSKNGLKLTKKQKEFAEQVVKTGNKSEAYRRAYNHKGKRTTAARDAQKVATSPHVATYINALSMAQEVEEYLLPSRLRTMAINKLAKMALNDDLAPSQQLKALELVGKMSEVSLFSQRVEHIHSVDSQTLKAQLLTAITTALGNSKSLQTRVKRTAESLLAELSEENPNDLAEIEGVGAEILEPEPPTTPHHPKINLVTAEHLHSIPHIQSPAQTEPAIEKEKVLDSDTRVNTYTYNNVLHVGENPNMSNNVTHVGINPKGEGVTKTEWVESNSVIETPPVTNWEEKG